MNVKEMKELLKDKRDDMLIFMLRPGETSAHSIDACLVVIETIDHKGLEAVVDEGGATFEGIEALKKSPAWGWDGHEELLQEAIAVIEVD